MPLIDLLAPPALDFRRHALTLGDCEARALVVLDYPPRVGQAWLARLAAMPGVSLSLHLSPSDPMDLLSALNKSTQEYTSRIMQGGNALAQSRWQQGLDDSKALLKQIDQESQKVYRTAVVLLVVAPDEDELSRRVRQVEASCAAASMRARPAVFRQEEGLQAVGPWGLLPKAIADVGAREMPAATVAAAYPWVVSGINHGHGCVLGRDGDGGIVVVDQWEPPTDAGQTNANVGLYGMPGSGKSYTAKLLLMREFAMGARIVVVDPEGEYASLARALGGHVVQAGGGRGRINPLQIPAVPDPPDPDEETEQDPHAGALSTHLQRVKAFFQLYLPSLSDLERAVLGKAALAAYRACGVDWDTDPATVRGWPTIRDVRERVVAAGEERLAVLLEAAADGEDAAMWSGQSTVTVGQSDFVVLNIKSLQEAEPAVRRAQFFNVLGFAWDVVREGRATGQRTVLLVDEAWILVDPEAPQALKFLRAMSKRIRKYGPGTIGAGLWIVTQNIGDFLAPGVVGEGKPVITNAATKIVMRCDPGDVDAMRPVLKMTDAECDRVTGARRGEGLLVSGDQRMWLRVEAAPHEAEIISGSGRA